MTGPVPHKLRILLIDSYDSFTHNLAALCKRSIPDCEIYIVKNDDIPVHLLDSYLDYFSAVVVGPGPGSPQTASDIGIVSNVWKIPDNHLLPVFGVCLGLQSLAIEHGARLKRLNVVKHGQISQIFHHGIDIFKDVGDISAVRYHSLHADLTNCEDVETLAWADDGEENGRVVMAAKHRVRPFWAVQYHPESVCTHGGGQEVLRNFWRLAMHWTAVKGREVRPWDTIIQKALGIPWPIPRLVNAPTVSTLYSTVDTRILEISDLTSISVCEVLGVSEEKSDFVLLESAAQPGRFSMIGCLTPQSPRIIHYIGDSYVTFSNGINDNLEDLGSSTIWSWLSDFMHGRKARGGVKHVPFWGGLIGYLSYELGVQSLSTNLPPRRKPGGRHPDANLVYVERSIVIDTSSGTVYVQSLLPDDGAWLEKMSLSLQQCSSIPTQPDATRTSPTKRRRKSNTLAPPVVTLPDRDRYISDIQQAKEYLFAGESYELCLTAPTRIAVPKAAPSDIGRSSSWDLYKDLRSRNPAPHSAYLRLHPSTLLSSSPERFLSFSRSPHPIYQLRPIKGTVRKAPGVTRAVAEKALAGSTKEVAENLMIVDLIRHDLHGVVGEDVTVKQFCKVEEYKTVWQLVSVIEGKPSDDAQNGYDVAQGWEVLRKSLPPGSMTGAPKKRSVEILHRLEEQDRGIYSGVFGYWDVGGSGDWSVTIRSCFKHDASAAEHDAQCETAQDNIATEEWTLGAGGAITALSDPEAEWEEMLVKVESVVRAFGDVEFS